MANSYSDFSLSFSHIVNPKVESGSHYEHQDILSLEGFELACNLIDRKACTLCAGFLVLF